ncbi:MAG: 50S ribosomal protein L10 [Proteobacteria bacterium]|nr:50S ribosomal protein L10 [Pseudomonadota bacterium]
MDRAKKEALVTELHETFEANNLLILTHQVGLSVVEVSELRQQMREAGGSFKVTKNRLAKIALKGTKFEGLTDQFTGPTAVAVSGDPVAAAKVAVEFAKKNDKLTVLCGGLGEDILDVAQVQALAKLPSLDELRGKLIGLFQAPAQKIASILQAPSGQLARVFGAYGNSE